MTVRVADQTDSGAVPATGAPAHPPGPNGPVSPRLVAALVFGQLGVHASMAGFRMAAPLQALDEGASTSSVGLVLALFAVAPVALALKAGRMADRHGFHRPMALATAMAMIGALLAVISSWVEGPAHIALLAVGALVSGAGANFGVIAIQRTAGQAARDAVERMRLFSWLGIAPSLANVIGPVSVGFMIDLAGFPAAYALVLAMPIATLWAMRQVPRRDAAAAPAVAASQASVWSLLKVPGMKRLLFVNWLLAICWDVHSFAVPVVGHGLGFSASVIGLILGTFTLSVSLVRLLIPVLAHRLREVGVIVGCMLGTMLIFAAYPLASSPWVMGSLSALLGITLGSVQPMVMSQLHLLTPEGRHGESLAFRSMAINFSSAVMPLIFGVAGVAVGAASLFWAVGASVGAGALVARRLRPR
ncbi:MAG: MFS transporter [Rubrivivax sp.]|nr:MFS transporter [Rubrivivax sp.]